MKDGAADDRKDDVAVFVVLSAVAVSNIPIDDVNEEEADDADGGGDVLMSVKDDATPVGDGDDDAEEQADALLKDDSQSLTERCVEGNTSVGSS